MSSTKAAHTPADLLSLPRPRDGRHYELSDGELIVAGNALAKHERVKRRILRALFAYELRYSTGEVYAESQFTLGAVKAISESEPAADAETKVGEYLRAGTLEIWQVYPRERRVRIRTTNAIRDLVSSDVLTSPVLPEFEVPVQSFFSSETTA